MRIRNNNPSNRNTGSALPRVALYARVSTQEQTKGNFPSCDSQLEDLTAYAKREGWEIAASIKDEGFSAGSLRRPGLRRIRQMAQDNDIDLVLSGWYDRFTRNTPEFYEVNQEFKQHNVQFKTVHDPQDTSTAAGRFAELILVGAKSYDREQTGEKVKFKMRQRLERGMYNGSRVPTGFLVSSEEKLLLPDPEKIALVRQMFQVYVEKRSDFAVRDFLKERHIPSPGGKSEWTVGTIRDLLQNRRYVAEIEINKENKGFSHVSEPDRYRIVQAPHEPLIPVELFELAQAIRREKAAQYPNNPGAKLSKSRDYGHNETGHVYVLQGLFFCAECGHVMSPHYVKKTPNEKEKRRTLSFVNHYVCAQAKKGGKDCDHRNRVLARTAESWAVEVMAFLVDSPDVLEQAVERARQSYCEESKPLQDELALTRAGLRENQAKSQRIIETITSGAAGSALMNMLSEQAQNLETERERLLANHRRLTEAIAPLDDNFDAATFRAVLSDFALLAREAEPEELRRLLGLLLARIEWGPEGATSVLFYNLPKKNQSALKGADWYDTNVSLVWRRRFRLEPLRQAASFIARVPLPTASFPDRQIVVGAM